MFRAMDDDASYALSEISDMGFSSAGAGIASPQSNVRFHSLQSVPRDINPQSIEISRANRSGISKLDLNMGQHQGGILDMYFDDCKSVHGLQPRPLVGLWNAAAVGADVFAQPRRVGRWVQTTKGMANFSALKLGDARLQRVASGHREEFRSPDDRKAYGQPTMDPSFRNLKSAGHAGCGLFAKSYLMADEARGDADSAVAGAASTAKLVASFSPVQRAGGQGRTGGEPGGEPGVDPTGRALRLSVYRTALQNLGAFDPKAGAAAAAAPQAAARVQPALGPWPAHPAAANPAASLAAARAPSSVLADLEVMFRNRLQFRAGKGVGRFHLQAMFALLDRSGRGGFDLEDFRQAVDALGLVFSEEQTIALFAKFDRGAKGYVSYHDFGLQIGFDAQDDVYKVQKLMTEYTFYAQRHQHLYQSWSADLSLRKSRVLAQVLREEATTLTFPVPGSRSCGGSGGLLADGPPLGDDGSQTVASKNTALEDWLQDVRGLAAPKK